MTPVISTAKLTKVAGALTGQSGGKVVSQVLQPNLPFTLTTPGSSFMILSSPIPITIQPHGGQASVYLPGQGNTPGGQVFSFLILTNTDYQQVTVVLWVGYEPMESSGALCVPTLALCGAAQLATGSVQAVNSNYESPGAPPLLTTFSTGFFIGAHIAKGSGIVPVNNAHNIYVGPAGGLALLNDPANNGPYGGQNSAFNLLMPCTIAPGGFWQFTAPPGKCFFLSDFIFWGTAGEYLSFWLV